jgi:hypothetical protein
VPDAVSDNGNPTDEDRDRYLRLLDNARGRGLLDVEEHAKRVVAVGSANSLDELNEIVWQLPVAERPTVQPKTRGAPGRRPHQTQVAPLMFKMETAPPAGGANATALPGRSALLEPSVPAVLPSLDYDDPDGIRKLDPVDVAMLQMRHTAKKPEPARRWAALVAVAFIFIVLTALGVILAVHSHSSSGGNGGLSRPGSSYSIPARST